MKKRHLVGVSSIALLVFVRAVPAASVDGAEIHWTSTGSGSSAVIFVHGWTCDDSSWVGQVPALSRTHRVITLDLPGHGKSGSPAGGGFTMDLFARAVEAVRAEAKVDRAVLVGHSMGTPVIRQYALRYPQRVRALVLVDGLVQVPGQAQGFTPPPMTGEAGLKAREAMVRGMFSSSTSPSLQDHILKMMLGTSEATAAGAMSATWDTSVWKSDPIKIPVLAVYAEKSGLANRNGMRRLYPTHEYHEIAGTGHFLMMEKPDEFNRLLSAFLEKLP